jgi:glycosyltransferase involved in cell wall biosynthesis
MPERSKITTIIVTKNSGEFLAACLQSLASQTVQADEIIAIDKNSTDETLSILEKFGGIFIFDQRSDGLANARNEGIARSTGDLITFLDSDDAWDPQKLRLQRDILERTPAGEAVTCKLKKIGDGECGEETLLGMTPSGFMFRYHVFEKFGLFNPSYRIGGDHEWFLRATRAGMAYAVLEATLMTKNIRKDSLSRNRSLYRREMMRILREHS